ncbi:head GIN domain-containing protein [soil metagenome]
MSVHAYLLAATLAGALATTACSGSEGSSSARDGDASGTANLSALRDFTHVEAAGPDTVIVSVGKSFAVAAQGDPKVLDTLDIKVVGGTLKIDRKTNWASFLHGGTDRGATIRVAMPAIAGASLTGSGDLSVDKADGPGLKLALTGSGDLNVAAVKVARLDADITGSGGITLAGVADSATLASTGSGDVSGQGFKAAKASVSIAGSGDMDFASDGSVDGRILGSGNVTVTGKPQCKVTVMGSGEVHCGA